MTVEIAAPQAVGFVLAMARAAAWVFVSPPFGTRMVPSRVKVGLAAALALALGPGLADQAVPLEAAPLLTAVALQVATGLALGFLGYVVFAAVQAAGQVLDLFSGLAMAEVFDPQTQVQTTVFGRFHQVLAITLLFALNGHLLLVRGFLTSFEAVPLDGFAAGPIARTVTDGVGLLLLAALEIVAPLLAALFLADIALGLLSRAAPEMHVFLLGLPLKILLTLLLAGLTLPLLPGAVWSLLERIVGDGLRMVGA